MKRKLRSTTSNLLPVASILALLAIWELVSDTGLVPKFMLPSPVDICAAFISDFPLLWENSWVTLAETFIGLLFGIIIGFVMAMLMDFFTPVRKALYPIVVITQTIPAVAIAPLLVLWFGYEMVPKIILVVFIVFFPVTVSLLDGFESTDKDTINLMRSMGAGKMQIFRYVKFPAALGNFFSSLKIAVSYAVVGAVISEWLGGFCGLGVYMTRVKKSYSFDKMFAVIFLISALSLLLMFGVKLLKKKCMPWENKE